MAPSWTAGPITRYPSATSSRYRALSPSTSISRGTGIAVPVVIAQSVRYRGFFFPVTLGQPPPPRSWALAVGRRAPGPFLVGLPGGGQRREQQLRPDLPGQAEGLEPGQQVLLDPGQGEHGAPADDVLAQGFHGLQRGEVHFHVG